MNLKISLLSILLMALPFSSEAQTARNPLNLEPARVTLKKQISSWILTGETFYLADGTQLDKRSYTFDENGRRIADVTLRWNKADNSWRNVMQSEYLYEKGKEIVIDKSERPGWSKTEIFSGMDGKPVYSLAYLWNKNAYDWSANPYQRCEWEYDSNGLVKACFKQYKNRATNEWDDVSIRILYLYDEAGVLNEELFQTWNAELNQWSNKGRYIYSTDNEQQKEAESYFYASGKWIFDGKTVYLYDGDGKITRCEYFNNSDKSLTAYSLFTYSEGFEPQNVAESNEINVYPNPAVSSFELSVPDGYFGKTMLLFNVSGNQVKSIPVHNKITQVDVNGLSSGVYLLKIDEVTKRVIIK